METTPNTPAHASMTKIFDRQIAKGLLSVSMTPGGVLQVWLNGRLQWPEADVQQLPAPAEINGTVYTHKISGAYAVKSDEAALIQAARAAYAGSLRGQREKLALTLAGTDADAFPGSRAWHHYNDAGNALQAFDDAHPEVFARLCEERRESLKGVDIAGL